MRIAAAVVFVTIFALVLIPVELPRLPMERIASTWSVNVSEQKCRLEVYYVNDERYWEGAPYQAECSFPHSVPFGNIGVDSNVGFRNNGRQFRGWKAEGNNDEWNCCKSEKPPPDSDYYNTAFGPGGYTEQESPYGAHSYAYEYYDLLGPCNEHDGSTFTVRNNWLNLRELDNPGDDVLVGILHYPDYSLTLDCDSEYCLYSESPWYEPTYRYGLFDYPYAVAQMSVTGETIDDDGGRGGPIDRLLVRRERAQRPRRTSNRLVAHTLPPAVASSSSTPLFSALQATDIAGPVSFMVLDSATGAPIKNAVVRVLDVDRQSKQITLRSSRTDASGGATLVAVTAQTHEVVVMAPGYGRERRTIALTRGRPTYLPVQLWPGASVSGFVRDGRGQPVGGATVSIQYEPVARDRLSRLMDGTWQRGTFETAPDSGGFRVLDVNAYAHFKIVVSVSGLPHAEVGPFYLDPGQQLSDLVIQLQR